MASQALSKALTQIRGYMKKGTQGLNQQLAEVLNDLVAIQDELTVKGARIKNMPKIRKLVTQLQDCIQEPEESDGSDHVEMGPSGKTIVKMREGTETAYLDPDVEPNSKPSDMNPVLKAKLNKAIMDQENKLNELRGAPVEGPRVDQAKHLSAGTKVQVNRPSSQYHGQTGSVVSHQSGGRVVVQHSDGTSQEHPISALHHPANQAKPTYERADIKVPAVLKEATVGSFKQMAIEKHAKGATLMGHIGGRGWVDVSEHPSVEHAVASVKKDYPHHLKHLEVDGEKLHEATAVEVAGVDTPAYTQLMIADNGSRGATLKGFSALGWVDIEDFKDVPAAQQTAAEKFPDMHARLF